MRDFQELKVWQRAHQLALETYQATAAFPTNERFGLTAHLRKTAVSIPSNIAEGCGRDGDRELGRFLSIAAGSTSELQYQLLLARDLGYLPANVHEGLDRRATEVRRMLYRFTESLS